MQCGVCKVETEEIEPSPWMDGLKLLVSAGECPLCESIFYMYIFRGIAYIIGESDLFEIHRKMASFHDFDPVTAFRDIATQEFYVN